MSWTLCSSGAAIVKAGAYVNSDIIASGARLAEFSDEVEATINMKTKKDWVAGYASVGTNFKNVLNDLATDLIAIKIINYDHSGYVKGESQVILDVLKDNSDTIIKDLREKQYQDEM